MHNFVNTPKHKKIQFHLLLKANMETEYLGAFKNVNNLCIEKLNI